MSAITTILNGEPIYTIVPPEEVVYRKYIKSIQSDLRSVSNRVSKSKRKAALTYGGWRHKRMYK